MGLFVSVSKSVLTCISLGEFNILLYDFFKISFQRLFSSTHILCKLNCTRYNYIVVCE
jgi:hypothetical protein